MVSEFLGRFDWWYRQMFSGALSVERLWALLGLHRWEIPGRFV